MAFGKNKDEVFQRISAVEETVEKPQKKKKKTKEQPDEAVQAPSTAMWQASGDTSVKARHFEASEGSSRQAAAAQSVPEENGNSIREVGARALDSRPEIGYTMTSRDEDVTGGLYSDSGRTVTMAMRLISYLMFFCGPLFFIGRIFSLIGMNAEDITTGLAVATVIDGIIGCILLVASGFIVIALIKILQNLMALQKKKMK